MKKITSIILIIAIIFSSVVTFADGNTNKLSDIEGHWAKYYVTNLIDKEVIDGYPDGTFRPNNPVRVDEFLKLTLVAMGHRLEQGNVYWAQPYIDKAIELKLISEGEIGDYQAYIKREEMASIIVNAASLTEPKPNPNAENYIKSGIKDYYKISDEYKQSVLDSYNMGFITGKDDGNFDSQGTATRGEASTIINRLLDKEIRQAFEMDEIESVEVLNLMTGEMMEVYPPVVDGEEVTEIIDAIKALKESFKLTDGYNYIEYNPYEHVVTTSSYENEEMSHNTSSNPMAQLMNQQMIIQIRTLDWGQVEEPRQTKNLTYQFMFVKKDEVFDYHRKVIESMFLHLFEDDYEEAMKYLDEAFGRPQGEFEKRVYQLNDRYMYIYIFTDGRIDTYISIKNPK
ncbi:S-layer homology domain-containing protein [Sporosalibacterium faouarense]|uniref:S-layer homology domain-containing protein n=1 Tax=Sporosalibacterium faouarense TaxID=516123 RepID=UPI00192C0C68|nr:S-layer homology domain-containing protein [Sporosalibacterium faouarense]